MERDEYLKRASVDTFEAKIVVHLNAHSGAEALSIIEEALRPLNARESATSLVIKEQNIKPVRA